MTAAAANDNAASGGRGRMILYTLLAVLALAGLADATYLTASHLAGETVTCIASTGCSDVLASAYAKIGSVPTAALGAVAYFVAFCAATLAAFRYRHARRVLVYLIGAMFLATLWFLYVQAFVLHAFCDYCLLSAAFVFAMAGLVIVTPPEEA